MSMNQRNLGEAERAISIGVGALLALGAVRRSAGAAALAMLGGLLALRGITGYCPVSQRLKHSPGKAHIDECIDTAVDDSFPASDPPAWVGGRV